MAELSKGLEESIRRTRQLIRLTKQIGGGGATSDESAVKGELARTAQDLGRAGVLT
jgi:hypothetical protein